MNEIRIAGILWQHGDNDYALWEGFNLTEEEEEIIANILFRYDTEGRSAYGAYNQIIVED